MCTNLVCPCRRQAWVDSRFDAVSEERRRELFEMYKAMLAEEAEATPQQHSRAQVRIRKVRQFPYLSHLSVVAGGARGGHPAAQHGHGLPTLYSTAASVRGTPCLLAEEAETFLVSAHPAAAQHGEGTPALAEVVV
jgi:hypothetical protein